MFEKFGEMDSAAEINELAETLFNEGDTDSIRTLAAENGVDAEYLEGYLSGDLPYLCDAATAAVGKLAVEQKEIEIKGLIADWVSYIEGQCIESEQMSFAVRRKGKKLKECLARLLKFSFENRMKVDPEIVKAAKIGSARVEFGIPGMAEAKRIIREYYLGGKA